MKIMEGCITTSKELKMWFVQFINVYSLHVYEILIEFYILPQNFTFQNICEHAIEFMIKYAQIQSC